MLIDAIHGSWMNLRQEDAASLLGIAAILAREASIADAKAYVQAEAARDEARDTSSISGAVPLHPPIGKPRVLHHAGLGEDMINLPGVIALAKRGDTPQAKRLYRLYLAEYRALDGQPLTQEKRQETAIFAAFKRMGVNFTTTDPKTLTPTGEPK
ncbi:MAG: hypothetical protein K2Y20_05480 [Sphingomonas sp.]|nr:hypothetical protein [Sphingomonas sp.]